jgi:hypothetical protein
VISFFPVDGLFGVVRLFADDAELLYRLILIVWYCLKLPALEPYVISGIARLAHFVLTGASRAR